VANIEPVLQADSSREVEVQKKRLRESCREFESVMISYMMKAMRDGTIRAEEPGNSREMYEEMLDGQVSKVIGRNSGLGVGEMLYSKLEPLIKAQSSQGPTASPAEAQTVISTAPQNEPGSG
jgi:Rod binding domain-containing protein